MDLNSQYQFEKMFVFPYNSMEHRVGQLGPITGVPTREMSAQALFTILNSFFL